MYLSQKSPPNPLAVATAVADEKGWDFKDSDQHSHVVTCSIPSEFGTYTGNLVHNHDLQTLRFCMMTSLKDSHALVLDNLTTLLNQLNRKSEYGHFRYVNDPEVYPDPFVSYVSTLIIGNTEPSEEVVELHMQTTLLYYNALYPALMSFTAAPVKELIDSKDKVRGHRLGMSVEDALKLIEYGDYGRA